jgi:hypothetical protein
MICAHYESISAGFVSDCAVIVVVFNFVTSRKRSDESAGFRLVKQVIRQVTRETLCAVSHSLGIETASALPLCCDACFPPHRFSDAIHRRKALFELATLIPWSPPTTPSWPPKPSKRAPEPNPP